jgi:hypothetical protein
VDFDAGLRLRGAGMRVAAIAGTSCFDAPRVVPARTLTCPSGFPVPSRV